jgi:hypothetical protein
MNIVYSSEWLEYFFEGPKADFKNPDQVKFIEKK